MSKKLPRLWIVATTAFAILGDVPVWAETDAGDNGPSAEEAPGKPSTPKSDKPAVEHLGGDLYRVGSCTLNRRSKEIQFPAQVNMNNGLLEYAVVTEKGKVHESLLVTKTNPLHLNVALLLLGFQPSKSILNPLLPEEEKVEKEPAAVGAAAKGDWKVTWLDGEEKKTAPLEAWIQNLTTKKPCTTGPWVYSGSSISNGQFLAEMDGSILALYLDPYALFNNPRPGNLNDETWLPAKSVPELGTEVTVTVRRHPNPSSP